MLDKIQQLLAEHLPEMAAKELKQYLLEAEKTKEDFEQLKLQEEKLQGVIKELSNQVDWMRKQLVSQEELEEKKSRIKKANELLMRREIAYDVTVLQIRFDALKESESKLFRLVEKVFGHPATTIQKTQEVITAIPGSSGCSGYGQRDSVNSSETTTQFKS